jgi:hypothetical protein
MAGSYLETKAGPGKAGPAFIMRPIVLIFAAALFRRYRKVVPDRQSARVDPAVGAGELPPEFGVAVIVPGKIPKRVAGNNDMACRRCRLVGGGLSGWLLIGR